MPRSSSLDAVGLDSLGDVLREARERVFGGRCRDSAGSPPHAIPAVLSGREAHDAWPPQWTLVLTRNKDGLDSRTADWSAVVS